MANADWNPWKLTAMGLILSIIVALVTGLVVANRTAPGPGDEPAVARSLPAAPPARPAPPPAVASAPTAQAQAPAARPASRTPTPGAIEACNRHASSQVGPHDKTLEIVKDGVIGAVAGAAVGAAGGAIAGGGKGAGTGAAIGGLVGAGGGTLYGLNENRRHDERYRDAYASCMRARGHLG